MRELKSSQIKYKVKELFLKANYHINKGLMKLLQQAQKKETSPIGKYILSMIIEIEPFQAFTINITASYPFAWEMIDHKYYRGEFGSTNIGYYQNYKIGVKIKF